MLRFFVFKQCGYAIDVALGDLCNVLCPALPVAPGADFVDDAGIDGVPPFADVLHLEGEAFLNAGVTASLFAIAAYTDDVDLVGLLLVELELVDRAVKAFVVGAECL